MKEITIEDVLDKYPQFSRRDFGLSGNDEPDYISIDSAKAAMTEYASLNRQGWTRVEDGLPKEGERVLICYKNEHGKIWRDVAFYTYGKVVEFDDEQDDFPECFDPEKGIYLLPKGFWFNSEVDENLFNRLNVTHWMPLPNKPI